MDDIPLPWSIPNLLCWDMMLDTSAVVSRDILVGERNQPVWGDGCSIHGRCLVGRVELHGQWSCWSRVGGGNRREEKVWIQGLGNRGCWKPFHDREWCSRRSLASLQPQKDATGKVVFPPMSVPEGEGSHNPGTYFISRNTESLLLCGKPRWGKQHPSEEFVQGQSNYPPPPLYSTDAGPCNPAGNGIKERNT